MIVSLMVFLTVLSLLAGAAAFLADRGLALARVPTRWLWLAALGLGPGLLVAPPVLGPAIGAATFFELPPLVVDVSGDADGLPLDRLAAVAWAASILFALTFFPRAQSPRPDVGACLPGPDVDPGPGRPVVRGRRTRGRGAEAAAHRPAPLGARAGSA